MFLLLKTYFNGFVMHFFSIGAKIDKKSPRGQTWLGKIYFDKYIKKFYYLFSLVYAINWMLNMVKVLYDMFIRCLST